MADLHVHTTYSDSALTPTEVVASARQAGLRYVAITDHDSVAGIPEALGAAKESPIEVVAGVEVSTRLNGLEIHILGLFVQPGRGSLEPFLTKLCEDRRARIFKMVARLKELGLSIAPDEVFQAAGKGSPGRMHVAEALRRKGQVGSIQEAFHRYIADDGPAYVPRRAIAPAQAVHHIRSAGGVPILAHPGLTKCDDQIPSLIRAGIMGIEVYYPNHTPAQEDFYLGIARTHGLLVSGGSDSHGHFKGDVKVGQVRIPAELVERIRRAAC